jgi:hypothetical protein
MAGILSKGTKLYVGEKALTDLQEFPDLGGAADSVEVTTLDSEAHVYINGLLSYGDTLAFKFLYAKAQFTELAALDGVQQFKVELPDKSTCSFSGECGVKMDAASVNAALTYTLNIKPTSAMVWA